MLAIGMVTGGYIKPPGGCVCTLKKAHGERIRRNDRGDTGR
jgi:hypothetical protein